MPRTTGVFIAVVILMASGCASNPHSHGGDMVAEHKPGDTPTETGAPYKAVYVLHKWEPLPSKPAPQMWIPEQHVAELYVRGLSRHDPVGFAKGPNGELLAVAGNEKIPLENGRYCWHISKDTQYTGFARVMHETGETAVGIVTFPVAVVAAVIVVPVFLGVAGMMMLM